MLLASIGFLESNQMIHVLKDVKQLKNFPFYFLIFWYFPSVHEHMSNQINQI